MHKVGTPSTKPGSFSSHQHTAEASLGHALKDTKTGPGGVAHLGDNALSFGGVLGNSGLGTSQHIAESPKQKGIGAAAQANIGGAMDKLKGLLNLEEIEDESALSQFRVKYK